MRRLMAVVAACVLCMVAVLAYFGTWPSDEIIEQGFREKPYYEYPTNAFCKSPNAIAQTIDARIDQGEDAYLLMGSSELSLVDPMQSHPYHFFNGHDYAVDTVTVGNGGFQSLYHAITLAALDKLDAVPHRRVALIVSMQWFFDGGCSPSAFGNSFSWETFELFAGNDSVSDETRKAIAKRVVELGVSPDDIEAAMGEGDILKVANYRTARFFEEKERRNALVQSADSQVRLDEAKACAVASEAIDWDALMQDELAEAKSCCTNNDWGIYDEYWTEYTEPWLENYDPAKAPEPFFDWENAELDDFRLFLQICNETGVEPLIVMAPAMGEYYDMGGYPAESRAAYYDMIRSTCDEYGVECVDYSSHDYEKYFLRDVMHLGWTGWVHVNRDLYDFYTKG